MPVPPITKIVILCVLSTAIADTGGWDLLVATTDHARGDLGVSGHGQEHELKRDCLRETAGYHHTCIAVFSGISNVVRAGYGVKHAF